MARPPRFPLTPIIDGAVTRLCRTDGVFSLIDTEDLPKVMAHSWRLEAKQGRRYLVTGKHHIQMARIILDVPKGLVPDHREGDGLDNRKANLRICTQRQNRQNSQKHKRPCTCHFKGVRLHKGSYLATICSERKQYYLGSFAIAEAAARAYDAKARELFGEFARCNFPEVAANPGRTA